MLSNVWRSATLRRIVFALLLLESVIFISLAYFHQDLFLSLPFSRFFQPSISFSWTNQFPKYSVNPAKPIHFTHIFSSKRPSGNEQSLEFKELLLIQFSWLQAARYAKDKGIQVEFIDATLQDPFTPSFSTHTNLSSFILSNAAGLAFATVGELFDLGKREGKGKYLIVSDSNVGVAQDFYVNVYRWASTHTEPFMQEQAINTTATAYFRCFTKIFKSKRHIVANRRLCALDAKETFERQSGGLSLTWKHVQLHVALRAAKLIQTSPHRHPSSLQRNHKMEDDYLSDAPAFSEFRVHTKLINHLIKPARLSVEEVRLKLLANNDDGYSPASTSGFFQNEPFSGVISPMVLSDSVLTHGSKEVALERLKYPKGKPSSAKNIFVITRAAVPDLLLHLVSPLPLVQDEYSAIVLQDSMPAFRIMTSSRFRPWTFQLSKKHTNESFILEQDALLQLFVAGSLGQAFQSRFTHIPRDCFQGEEALHRKRPACDKYIWGSKALEYLFLCDVVHFALEGRVQNPVCALCNFLYQTLREGEVEHKRFTCKLGKLSYCQHLTLQACRVPVHFQVVSHPTFPLMDDDSFSTLPHSSHLPISLTHVFSTSPESSLNGTNHVSWLRAAQFALEQGIRVEFMDNTLPVDAFRSPRFSRHLNLTWTVPSVLADTMGPTFGEMYSNAFEHAKGMFVIVSAADVSLSPNFYVRMYEWASADFLASENRIKALKFAGDYFAQCLLLMEHYDDIHAQLCVLDSQSVFEHQGGIPEMWPGVKRDIGTYAARRYRERLHWKLRVQAFPGGNAFPGNEDWLHQFTTIVNYFISPLKSAFHDVNFVFAFEPKGLSQEAIRVFRQTHLSWKPFAGAVETSGGSDVVVIHRDAIPVLLRTLPHPLRSRLLDTWIPLIFASEGIPYRRLRSHTGKNVLASHVHGVDSPAITTDSSYFLFLAGNFDALSGSHRLFQSQFVHVPEACEARGFWDDVYCNHTTIGCVQNSKRVGCAKFSSLALRENAIYLEQCQALFSQEVFGVQEPVCSLCNFLFVQHKAKTKHFECLPGKFPGYCNHVPDYTCTYLKTSNRKSNWIDVLLSYFFSPSSVQEEK